MTALDANTGKKLWSREPEKSWRDETMSIAAVEGYVCFLVQLSHHATKIELLESTSGRVTFESKVEGWFDREIRTHKGAFLFSRDGKLWRLKPGEAVREATAPDLPSDVNLFAIGASVFKIENGRILPVLLNNLSLGNPQRVFAGFGDRFYAIHAYDLFDLRMGEQPAVNAEQRDKTRAFSCYEVQSGDPSPYRVWTFQSSLGSHPPLTNLHDLKFVKNDRYGLIGGAEAWFD